MLSRLAAAKDKPAAPVRNAFDPRGSDNFPHVNGRLAASSRWRNSHATEGSSTATDRVLVRPMAFAPPSPRTPIKEPLTSSRARAPRGPSRAHGSRPPMGAKRRSSAGPSRFRVTRPWWGRRINCCQPTKALPTSSLARVRPGRKRARSSRRVPRMAGSATATFAPTASVVMKLATAPATRARSRRGRPRTALAKCWQGVLPARRPATPWRATASAPSALLAPKTRIAPPITTALPTAAAASPRSLRVTAATAGPAKTARWPAATCAPAVTVSTACVASKLVATPAKRARSPLPEHPTVPARPSPPIKIRGADASRERAIPGLV